jgi:hypothetical protein
MESGGAANWAEHFERERARYADGEARLPGLADRDDRQRQLTRMGNAAGGAGLALLMAGRRADAAAWFARASERYRESFADAPPESWGRPIGAVKARLLAGDRAGAEDDADWTLAAGARESASPIGRYAACLALLVLGDDAAARETASGLLGREDFPDDVARTLVAIASGDDPAYRAAIADVLRSSETRDEYLEDVAVADTVVVLRELAERRGLRAAPAAGLVVP